MKGNSAFIRNRGLEAAAYTAWKAARLVRGIDKAPILARRDAIETNRRILACLTSAHNPRLARLALDAAEAQPSFRVANDKPAQIINIS